MNTMTIKKVVLGALLLTMAAPALAQEIKRPSKTFYVYPHVGLSTYIGDRDHKPFIHYWDIPGKLPILGGLEVGYEATPHIGYGIGLELGNFPTIWGDTKAESKGNYTNRWIGTALLRWTPGGMYAKRSPYFEIGAMVNNGQEINRSGSTTNGGDIRLAYGPMVGVGFDIAVSRRASLMLGGHLGAQFSDSRTDADDFPAGRGNAACPHPDVPGVTPASKCYQWGGPFDLLGGFGLGLKYHFKDAFSPVDVMAVDGPSSLECGQTGTFTATVADGATMPVEYRWDFGDGGTGEGLVATHSFTRPGTYTVTFSGSNSGSMDSASTTVTCTPPPVPAGVVSFSSTPANTVCLNNDVRFSTSARGDAPVNYAWNFGDGSTGTGANPTHRYTRAGTYTVTLNVNNAAGSDSRTMQITANNCDTPPPTAACSVNELNSVFFDVNSSTLTETARQALRENIDALRSPGCEGTRVRIEGFAGPGERNPQQLSEDRARAVMQFYTDNGIMSNRLSMMGMGMVGGTTSKKDDTSSLRRVDSIPVR